MQRATIQVLLDCETNCTTATVERTIPINYRNVTDRWGFRPLTLNARNVWTRYQGRMARSVDKSVVQLTGYGEQRSILQLTSSVLRIPDHDRSQ